MTIINDYHYYTPTTKKEEIDGVFYGYSERSVWGYSVTRIDDKSKTHHFNKKPFKICASVKDFDTKNMNITDGYKLQQNIPDPVVLQPVKGGYLVVSKWGLEGKDELLVNETNN